MAVCEKMVAARYLKIAKEETTINYFINGLKKHATLAPRLGHIIASKPETIKQVTQILKLLHNINQPFQSSTAIHLQAQEFTGDYGSQSQPTSTRPSPKPPPNYNDARLQPCRTLYPYQRIPFHQLCTYHKSMGVRYNHTDAHCWDSGHPKFWVRKPQANYMQTDINSALQPYPQGSMAPPISQYPYHTLPSPHTHSQHNPPNPAPDNAQVGVSWEAETEYNGTFVLDSGADQQTYATLFLTCGPFKPVR